MFESPDHALKALSRVGYFIDQKTATTVYLAGKINKPIMLEGPAGAGKTELAQSVCNVILPVYAGLEIARAVLGISGVG